MALEQLIAGSYGSADGIFAGHDSDRERALESLIAAHEEGVGFAEFLQRHREYLGIKGFLQAHIEEQLQKVQQVSSYFDED